MFFNSDNDSSKQLEKEFVDAINNYQERLKDPESMILLGENGYYSKYYSEDEGLCEMLSFTVNAKNGLGGYVGTKQVEVTYRNGAYMESQSEDDDYFMDVRMTTIMNQELIKAGKETPFDTATIEVKNVLI